MPIRGSDVCLILVAIIFPPAAAAFIAGCSCDLLINILLTVLGYLPGHIHAFWLIYKRMKAEEMYGRGGYLYVGNGEFRGGAPGPAPVGPGYAAQPAYAAQPGYGATATHP